MNRIDIENLPSLDGFGSIAAPRPWRIDKDNAEGIEIVADDGTLIFCENYGDYPTERGSNFIEQMAQMARANAYLIVEAVNRDSKRNHY